MHCPESSIVVLNISEEDLAQLRFGYRPLIEIPLSFRVFINPKLHGPYAPWIDEVNGTLHDVTLPYLDALVPPTCYIPDFLTPAPTSTPYHIEIDLQRLLSLPDEVIQRDVMDLIRSDGETEMRRFFLSNPHEAIAGLVDDLRTYWRRALERHWSRITSIQDSDIAYHARVLALNGCEALLNHLHPTITYHHGHLMMAPLYIRQPEIGDSIGTNRVGLQLTPSVFGGCGRAYHVKHNGPTMLTYRAWGSSLWYREPALPNISLEIALGASRAQVLQSLAIPSTTGEIAFRLHLTAGAASQHLGRLTKAGLIEPRRRGKRVYYHLTTRGESLLAAFDTTL
jgi:DNA-binding transcriptional ArsR family regulator